MGGRAETGFEMDGELAGQLRALGVPEDQIAAAQATRPPAEPIECFEDVLQSAMVFKAMMTQWNVIAGSEGAIVTVGLNYASFPVAARYGVGVKPRDLQAVFADLQIMEDEALKVYLEKLDERAGANG